MSIKDLKYLSSLIIPFLAILGLLLGGMFSYGALIFAFILIPILEPFFKSSKENLSQHEKQSKLSFYFFDVLLYLNIPIIYVGLYILGVQIKGGALDNYEIVGHILSFGTLLGACGINVAHELGHKNNLMAKVSAVTLLVPSFYSHFIIEHNRGHHKHVATPLDPATSRKNEMVYTFWLRSIVGSYQNAWNLEFSRLERLNHSKIHYKNMMIHFFILQLLYIVLIVSLFNAFVFFVFFMIGIISFIFLETINYVEHYGLQRALLPSGRYERVLPKHSWNSNHHLGRIILYELTRHSDHHFMASKKYQVLDHHDESLQLPYGYPTSMLMSLVPPLWFYKMNPILEREG